MKKFFQTFFLICIICANYSLFCQTLKLSEINPEWTTVTKGKALCPPVAVPAGFVIAHDGNALTGFLLSGKVFWEKTLQLPSEPSLDSSKYGILFTADKNNVLYILNCSGIEVYKAQLEKTPDYITAGLDGRYFIFADKKLFCYGANGICKWNIELSSQKEPVLLSDGSLLVFQPDSTAQNSAVRISPYGEKKQIFEFNSQPVNACSTDSTLYILLADRTVKTYSMNNFSPKQNLTLPQELELKTGKNDFYFEPDSSNNLYLTLCDKKTLVSFSTADSSIKKKTVLDLSEIKDAQLATDGNYLLCSCKNWETMYYKLFPSPKKKLIKETPKKMTQGTLSLITIPQKKKLLASGLYAQEEKELCEAVYEILETYYTYLTTPVKNEKTIPPDYVNDTSFLKEIIDLAGCFGTDYFAQTTARLITVELKAELLTALISSASNNGLDPNAQILSAIEQRLIHPSIQSNTEIIKAASEALYRLSLYMGTEYSKRATTILAKIATGNAGIQQKKEVQKAMRKIGSLKVQ